MELMIDISEEDYEAAKKVDTLYGKWRNDVTSRSLRAIANGTPLPKGHGDLIDIDDIRVVELEDSLHFIQHKKGDDIDVYIDAPTVIKADKG